MEIEIKIICENCNNYIHEQEKAFCEECWEKRGGLIKDLTRRIGKLEGLVYEKKKENR